MPVTDDDTQTLELFTHKQSAREAVDHARKIKTLTGGGGRIGGRREPAYTV